MRNPPAADALECGKAPIVLIGEPARLIGRLPIRNRAGERIVLRQVRLRGDFGGRAQDCAVPLVAVLAPSDAAQVTVRAAIDPHTPPGRYAAELVVGERSLQAQVQVVERVELQVAPEPIVVENRPGRQRKQALFANRGNVPLKIGNLGAVVLDEELIGCKTLRAALAESGETAKTIDEWISAYLRQGKRQLDAIGMLWVEVAGAPLELAPGTSASVDLEVRVPDSLDPRSRYEGVAFLYDESLRFAVLPVGAEKRTPEVIRQPAKAPATRKRSRRSA